MKNPFRTAPLPVRLTALLLVALPVTNTGIILFIYPREVVALTWESQVMALAGALAVAAGLLLGVNFLRLLFIAYTLFSLVLPLVQPSLTDLPSAMTPLAIAQWIVLLATLVLTLLPAAGRHFGRHGWANIRVSPAVLDHGPARLAWTLPLVLVGLFVASSVRQRMLIPQPSADRIHQAISTQAETPEAIAIGHNLRLLSAARSQYAFEHPGRTPRFEDLVDDGKPSALPAGRLRSVKFISGLTPAFGETYPPEFPPGIALAATLPDGTRYVLDEQHSRVVRFPGKSAVAKTPPVPPALSLDRAREIAILNNCRMLNLAIGQYSLMNRVTRAPIGELVGSGKLIPQLSSYNGEHYAPEIDVEKAVVVTLKDGTRMTPDASFSKLIPAPAP